MAHLRNESPVVFGGGHSELESLASCLVAHYKSIGNRTGLRIEVALEAIWSDLYLAAFHPCRGEEHDTSLVTDLLNHQLVEISLFPEGSIVYLKVRSSFVMRKAESSTGKAWRIIAATVTI